MKTCKKCQKEKDECQFNRRSCTRDKLNLYCKECSRQYTRTSYTNNREYYIKRNRAVVKELEETVRSIKKSTPCKDCGNYYPYYVMDFDHRDAKNKDFCVASKRNWGRKKLFREIAKCDVVCSNCHRERTHKRLHP